MSSLGAASDVPPPSASAPVSFWNNYCPHASATGEACTSGCSHLREEETTFDTRGFSREESYPSTHLSCITNSAASPGSTMNHIAPGLHQTSLTLASPVLGCTAFLPKEYSTLAVQDYWKDYQLPFIRRRSVNVPLEYARSDWSLWVFVTGNKLFWYKISVNIFISLIYFSFGLHVFSQIYNYKELSLLLNTPATTRCKKTEDPRSQFLFMAACWKYFWMCVYNNEKFRRKLNLQMKSYFSNHFIFIISI